MERRAYADADLPRLQRAFTAWVAEAGPLDQLLGRAVWVEILVDPVRQVADVAVAARRT
jgi:hypothetical protein